VDEATEVERLTAALVPERAATVELEARSAAAIEQSIEITE